MAWESFETGYCEVNALLFYSLQQNVIIQKTPYYSSNKKICFLNSCKIPGLGYAS